MYDENEAVTKDTFYKIGFAYLEQVCQLTPTKVKEEMERQGLNPYSFNVGEWRGVFKIIERLGEEYEETVVTRAVSAFKASY